MAGKIEANVEAEQVEGLDLQSLPGDALELIVAVLDRKQVSAVSRQCRSLREAALTTLRGSLRRLLDRSAYELSVLRNQALTMREQSLAGRRYVALALLITTARLVRMELRLLAAASWRHLCAPVGPGLALPGSLLDQIESLLDAVASGELTSAAQPEATASVFLRCEKFLDFFSDVLEPPLVRGSVVFDETDGDLLEVVPYFDTVPISEIQRMRVGAELTLDFQLKDQKQERGAPYLSECAPLDKGWTPIGSRLADTLAVTHARRVHKEVLTRTGHGIRLTATYRLPGLVEVPPTLPQTCPSVPLTPADRTAFAAAAERVLAYVRRSVHMHNLVLVLKDQWAMDDALERRGSVELQSGFIFEHHDQPGECQFSRSETKPECCPSTGNSTKNKLSRTKWDGLLCELQMFAPSLHLLPPHLQHLTSQIWPESSIDTFKSIGSCLSIKITATTPNISSANLVRAENQTVPRGGVVTPCLSRKSTRLSHSLMTVNNIRNGDADTLQKSLSFDNIDAVKEVLLRRLRRQDPAGRSSLSSLAPKTGVEIKAVDLSVVGNSCVCFAFSELDDAIDDVIDDVTKTPSDKLNASGSIADKEKAPLCEDFPVYQVDSSSHFPVDNAYYFRLQITARYPEPNKTKSGLREATIIVVDSEDGASAWLVDDVSVC